MKNTSIEWTDHTWNPWRGCTRVEKALDCVNCYAATLGHRFGIEWGPGGIRVESSERTWREPFRWAKRPWICNECGSTCTASNGESLAECPKCECTVYAHRARVFALSMGDWLEDEPVSYRYGKAGATPGSPLPVGGVPVAWLARMLDTIRQTPTLNWILLTKRPEKWADRMDAIIHAENFNPDEPSEFVKWIGEWVGGTPPDNVCVMTSVGYQKAADDRIPHLLRIPARWRGLSLEPLLESVDLTKIPMGDGRTWSLTGTIDDNGWPESRLRPLHLLIVGGESGHGARLCDADWIRYIIDQGESAGCRVFVKQLGARPFGRWAKGADLELPSAGWKLRIDHPKCGDPAEWPKDLRVRQFPEGM